MKHATGNAQFMLYFDCELVVHNKRACVLASRNAYVELNITNLSLAFVDLSITHLSLDVCVTSAFGELTPMRLNVRTYHWCRVHRSVLTRK